MNVAGKKLLQLVILVQDAVAVIIRVFIIFKTVAIIVLVAVQDTVTVVVVILRVGLTISVEILVLIEDAVTVIIFVVDIKEAVIVVIVIFGVLDAITIGVIITCTSTYIEIWENSLEALPHQADTRGPETKRRPSKRTNDFILRTAEIRFRIP